MKNKFAFTLAEVLITLTIIGVIAALTIPNLMQRYQEHATVNKVKKFYSTFSNAYTQAIKENGPVDEWGLGKSWNSASSVRIYELLIKPYFKIQKNCEIGENVDCIAKDHSYLSGEPVIVFQENKYYKVITNDGGSIIFRSFDNKDMILIYFDVNGKKEPNKIGVDTFAFVNNENTFLPYGYPLCKNCDFDSYCNNKISYSGSACTAWLIYKGNMDYLHCSDLSWNGKNKCQ